MNKLEKIQDIVADEYDGCYELMRECVKAYADIDNSILNFNDLNLILMIPVGTWSLNTEKKKDLVRSTNLKDAQKEELISLIDTIQEKANESQYTHCPEGKYKGCWGMFGTGFYSATSVTSDISTSKDFIKLLVKSLSTPKEKLFAIVDETIKSCPLDGLQSGMISQVMHCLYPTVFPILNTVGRDIYDAMRLRLTKPDSKKSYISNCQTIQMFRDKYAKFKNYRVFDLLSLERAREIGFGLFVENYTNPKALLNDIDTILPNYISKLTADYKTLYQIPDAKTAKDVQTILRKDKGFWNKSKATSNHRPSSCFKKYSDFFSWWINPVDPLAQPEVIDDDFDDELYVTEYSFSTDPDKPFISESKFNEIVALLERKKNVILEGAPGVGKTFLARKLAYQLMGLVKDENIEMVQFHQSYSYEDFVQGIRPSANGEFKTRTGVFYDFCTKAQSNPTEKFIFIIDEINRGNLSKIFGELMMLIEANKRTPKYAIKLTYSDPNDEKFYVPDNVYILGCMNTADRSLAIVDYALRRRFAFFPIVPEFGDTFSDFLKQRFDDEFVKDICVRLKSINDLISQHPSLGVGMEIGHSYFCDFEGADNQILWWESICKYELIPYIHEICFDDDDLAKQLCDKLML